jgi:hypothetical protein
MGQLRDAVDIRARSSQNGGCRRTIVIVRSTGHSVLHFLWREKVHHFSSLDAALQFLAPFKDNPGQMAELRRLLMEENGPVDLTRATNDQLIRATAGMLVGRELLVGIEWKGRLPAVAGD